ncbi:hypothetical protein C5167_010000 [Papaver somniferum]|uniref:Uncharacterized protein n=1 Tax=Papaver somniferum TaxID=3469 RepID=A0A4Y7JZ02_PAPSO|nr:hypothetical protein C5167_010000 [Papaver somniferum]
MTWFYAQNRDSTNTTYYDDKDLGDASEFYHSHNWAFSSTCDFMDNNNEDMLEINSYPKNNNNITNITISNNTSVRCHNCLLVELQELSVKLVLLLLLASPFSFRLIWREASRIVPEEGFRALWKGNLVTIVHCLPYSSISLGKMDSLQSIPGLERRRENVTSDLFVRLVGGGLAGIIIQNLGFSLLFVTSVLKHQVGYYAGIWA